jgi:hypothetical protein
MRFERRVVISRAACSVRLFGRHSHAESLAKPCFTWGDSQFGNTPLVELSEYHILHVPLLAAKHIR